MSRVGLASRSRLSHSTSTPVVYVPIVTSAFVAPRGAVGAVNVAL